MRPHSEGHLVTRTGWLRAAVLGANDGIISTASLLVGVAASSAPISVVLLTGTAGLVAGAMSMAAGEYVSVSSQRDIETADRALEAWELANMPEQEREEMVGIYQARGLDRALAEQVTDGLMANDALGTHLRDELGLSENLSARPIQAAAASAMAFSLGAAFPLAVVPLFTGSQLPLAISLTAIVLLALLGFVSARLGGVPVLRPMLRVTFWGAVAMAATALIGSLFGATIA